MRNRFFFIILTTLILAAVGINLVHVNFFKSQRLKLIDKQITESSDSLLASKEFRESRKDPKTVEETISKVLKGTRIGKVFILRNSQSQILYQSFNVSHLEAELPIEPEWLTVQTDTEFVRVRNIPLGKQNHILQVGLVLDRNFINWEIIDDRVVSFIVGIVLTLFLASVLLTLILLSPLRLLISHLKESTSNLTNLRDVQPLPKPLTAYTKGFWARSDEFSSLLNAVQKLIDRINLNYKLTRSWTFQMAHELKTPLAIIRAETEARQKKALLPPSYAQDVVKEIEQMSEIINQFLEWAEIENSNGHRDLHALRMKSVVKAVSARLDKISPGRIQTHLDFDFSVFANPIHLDQMISNLLNNALKFSPTSTIVEVALEAHVLIIRDQGSGIPKEVKERLGEPFNVGSHQGDALTGNGLGLAWVFAVAKLYQWKFEIQSLPQGTEVRVRFPTEHGIDDGDRV